MLEFIKNNWQYFVYGFQFLSVLIVSIVLFVKNRKLRLIEIASVAVEEAEKLEGTAEQKKAYATALIKQELNISNKCVSFIIEKLIRFSKFVNAKRNKTIQEVLSDEFKETN